MSSNPVHGEVYSIQHKVCQWLATGLWFSPGTQFSSTNKTNHHNIAEISLKVASNTINLPTKPTQTWSYDLLIFPNLINSDFEFPHSSYEDKTSFGRLFHNSASERIFSACMSVFSTFYNVTQEIMKQLMIIGILFGKINVMAIYGSQAIYTCTLVTSAPSSKDTLTLVHW